MCGTVYSSFVVVQRTHVDTGAPLGSHDSKKRVRRLDRPYRGRTNCRDRDRFFLDEKWVPYRIWCVFVHLELFTMESFWATVIQSEMLNCEHA